MYRFAVAPWGDVIRGTRWAVVVSGAWVAAGAGAGSVVVSKREGVSEMIDGNRYEALRCLTDLGEAYREDWSDFDGRTLRDELSELADLIRREERGDDVHERVQHFRDMHGLSS